MVIAMFLFLTVLISLIFSAESYLVPLEYVAGGQRTADGQFPHHATMMERKSTMGTYQYIPKCGATVISDEWVITAGHCIELSDLTKTKIISGVANIHDKKHGIVSEIEYAVKHPNFTMIPRLSNDIGLIKLKNPIKESKFVKFAELPEKNENLSGIELITTGVGSSFWNDQVEDVEYINVSIIPDYECQMIYFGGELIFTPSQMMCARGLNESSVCGGDSGGPLVKKTHDGKFILVGIVSFGNTYCQGTNFPFVNTNVSIHLDWIKSVIGK